MLYMLGANGAGCAVRAFVILQRRKMKKKHAMLGRMERERGGGRACARALGETMTTAGGERAVEKRPSSAQN
jgi:hypothetical protein